MSQIKNKQLNIGVSGNKGSFSEMAAMEYIKQEKINAQISYLIDMDSVLNLLLSQQIDLGILPIVNNNASIVTQTLEAMGKSKFKLKDSFSLQVDHYLMALPGIKAHDIKEIVSHPQALMQCQKYLKKRFPSAKLTEWIDTAEAARMLSVQKLDKTVAVIAPSHASDLYGLSILDSKIQDKNPNLTTFIVVSRLPQDEQLKDLNSMRNAINDIDKMIISLLAKRNKISQQIGEYKSQNHIPIFDKKRENELTDLHESEARKNALRSEYVNDLFQIIFDQSKQHQKVTNKKD